MLIDLRSDTVTKPSKEMLEAMLSADLGDDVFNEDPTVHKLENKCAELFGFEAGIFCPSGTMTNQIAIKCHTQPLDEIICDKLCHIYNYETGGWAFHSGVSVRLSTTERGIMTVADVAENILPDYDWFPNSKMVCIENTVNKGGGAVYKLEEMKKLSEFCKENKLIYHLDGARIFNALTVLNEEPIALQGLFDSVSVCLSKGLGAPVGSVLLGKKEFIKKARKIRKVMGGGMRQSGLLAAAGLFALENNRKKLAQDHHRTKALETVLNQLSWVKKVMPVETNIVIFEVENAALISEKLKEKNVLCSPFSPTLVRMVTHLDFTDSMLENTISILKTFNFTNKS